MYKLIFNKFKNYLIIIDQGFVSLFNFFFVIILIRLIGLEEFGIFSILWIGILLFTSIQQSLIISPLFSLSPLYKDKELIDFNTSLIFQNLILILIISIIGYFTVVLGKYFNLKYFSNINSFFYFLSILFITMQNFFKKFSFSRKENILGFLINFISYLFLFSILITLSIYDELNVNNILLSYALSFFIGSLFSVKYFFKINFIFKDNKFFFKENWKISKWIFFSNFFYWFSGYFWAIMLGNLISPSLVAVIRACTTLAYSINVFYQALENFVPTNVSSIYKSDGFQKTHLYIKKLCLEYFIISLIFFIIILIFSEKIMYQIYGSILNEYYYVLIYFGLLNLINCFQYPIISGLRTFKNTKPLFIAYLISSTYTLLFSYILIETFKLNGFLVGLFINQVLLISFVIYGYHTFVKDKFI